MVEGKLIAYESTFKLRRAIKNKNSLKVTFPYQVVEKEAKSRGLTVDEFMQKFHAVAQYNGFQGVRYIFREMNGGK
jgi:hypothetical protein